MKSTLASWLGSIGIGVLVAIAAGVLGGWLANRAVDWYSISSFEGGSGYFVVGLALMSAIAGFVIGVVASRIVSGSAFSVQLGVSLAAATVVIGSVGIVSRLLAHVPPTYEGEAQLLLLEVSWPESSAPDLSKVDGAPRVELSYLTGNTTPLSRTGPLFTDDMRREGGRVIVPGAVEVFTSRGKRLLTIIGRPVDTASPTLSHIVPLPSRPGAAEREWSEWLPGARDGAPPLTDDVRYRFRTIKRSEVLRSETVGDFTVDIMADGFDVQYRTGEPVVVDVAASFRVKHAGRGVQITPDSTDLEFTRGDDERGTLLEAVSVIGGHGSALIVKAYHRQSFGHCYLLVAEGGSVRTQSIGNCGYTIAAHRFADSADTLVTAPPLLTGVVDRHTFAAPARYLTTESLIDTRTLTLQRLARWLTQIAPAEARPLSLAPDASRFAHIVHHESGYRLAEVSLPSLDTTIVSVDDIRVPSGRWMDIDRQWLAHYFAWEQAADGTYHLVKRPDAAPLPYAGKLSTEPGYQEYRVRPVSVAMRDSVVALLVRDFGGSREPVAAEAFSHDVLVAGQRVYVGYDQSDACVIVFVDRDTYTRIVAEIALRFDAELASGRLDGLFSSQVTP